MRDLTVALIQEDLVWQDPAANRRLFEARLEQVTAADLVVLPEMFTTGFTMAAKDHSETMDGATVTWMQEQATARSMTVAGSLIIAEQGRHYNRLIVAAPDAPLQCYDKRHLFRMAEEHAHYTAGRERVIATVGDWRVALQVCYDLRFPVFSRNRDDYDLLLYVANWPAARHTAWETLLRARAMENLSYCAGVNRVGRDGASVAYQGGSVILDFIGTDLAAAGDVAGIAQARLSAAALQRFRRKFPAHLDADDFSLNATD